MAWFLYIAEARTGNFYVGITTDPARRIGEHNAGKGATMAKTQGPFRFVYVSDDLGSQSVSRTWEIRVKKWSRDRKKRVIAGEIGIG